MMCTYSELKEIIREEYDDLETAVKNSGISEDLFLNSITSCFMFNIDHNCFGRKRTNKSKESWIDNVYRRAVEKTAN